LQIEFIGSRTERVKIGFWYLAKGLQASALCVVAYALWVGVATENAHSELEWLLGGAFVFAMGLIFERISGGGPQG
jgi:hypothetical protein